MSDQTTHPLTPEQLDAMQCAYVDCALWASSDQSDDQGGTPLEDLALDVHPTTLVAVDDLCLMFVQANPEACALWVQTLSATQLGHDLFLTRNRHGAGFWDRFHHAHSLAEVGQRLTAAAHAEGSDDWYVGDDGFIHSTEAR
jgi:hypothetical protein